MHTEGLKKKKKKNNLVTLLITFLSNKFLEWNQFCTINCQEIFQFFFPIQQNL